MLKAFLKDSAIYTIPTIISRGLSFFLIPLYTRVLSPSDYGSLDLLTVFISIVNLTIALEISQGLARYYTEENDGNQKVKYASTVLWFTILCYTIFAIVVFLNSNYLSPIVLGQQGLVETFQIGIAYMWVNGIFYLVQNQFRWELKSRNYSIISVLMSLVTAIVSVWLAYYLKMGLNGILIGLLSGVSVGSIVGLVQLRKTFGFQFDMRKLREMLKFSMPLVFSSVAVWLSLYIDRIMINHLLAIDQVGLYGIGYRVASIAGMVMVGFQGALTPLIFTHYKEKHTPIQIEKIFRLFLSLTLIVFMFLTLFSKDILVLLTTPEFYGGSIVVIYLVPAVLLANMYIFAPGIGIAKKNHFYIWINVSGAILNVILNYLLIPYLGIIGAGVATSITYLGTFILHMVISQKLYYVPHRWFPIVTSTLCALLITATLSSLEISDTCRWSLNIIGVLTYIFTILFVLKLIKPEEILSVLPNRT